MHLLKAVSYLLSATLAFGLPTPEYPNKDIVKRGQIAGYCNNVIGSATATRDVMQDWINRAQGGFASLPSLDQPFISIPDLTKLL
jgi:hypothetical protein